MIFGVGVDIVKIARFEKWAKNPALIERFFNERERLPLGAKERRFSEHYAARFAAKEAFSKALGTGLCGFALSEVWIENKESGEPKIVLSGNAQKKVVEKAGSGANVFVSLSHEKEFAVAFVVIERQ